MQLELAGYGEHPLAHLHAIDGGAGRIVADHFRIVVAHRMLPACRSTGELESRRADLHGTPTTPGWGARLLICRSRSFVKEQFRRSWHLSVFAAVAPASLGLIPQPVSMSA